MFKMMNSVIPNAGKGLFFKGTCVKNEFLCGYPGEVKINSSENYSNYSAALPNTKYLIDATIYANTSNR